MARRAKMTDEPENKSVSRTDLQRVVGEINRQKKLASEYAGNAGKATQSACEQYGLEKNALTFTRRLAAMESAKQQSVLRSTIEYCEKMGFFDQIDAFSDTIAVMKAVVDRAHNVTGGEQPAPAPTAEDAEIADHLVN